ncbi:hypothetical protein [Yoonia sp. SS1-5]|uniref:Uncharacterized protein n=1 Tax=Yoonia rhodophyticola TaxID=3137370 RepID=A0AAN0MLY5_9RHOB
MSEPFCLAFYAPINPDQFPAALTAPVTPPTTFNDWDMLGQYIYASDLRETPSTAGKYLDQLRAGSAPQMGWHFAYDKPTGYLTGMSLLWTDSMPEIIGGFNVLRQLLATAGNGQAGYVLAHGFAFPDNGTLGGIVTQNGRSEVRPAQDDQIQRGVRHATPRAKDMLMQAQAAHQTSTDTVIMGTLALDELDLLAGR